MIEVPERVKDALREGNMLKRYTFDVYDFEPGYFLVKVIPQNEFYGINDTEPIRVISNSEFTLAVGLNGELTYIPSMLNEDGKNYVDINNPVISSTIYVSEFVTPNSTANVYVYNAQGGTTYFDTIDNTTLVKESVKFDERMCSGKDLKFGLCEGSSLEFQYFDHDAITGKRINATVEIQYTDADGVKQWFPIPMGWFTVDQCPMQASTGIFKVTAYNKLRSNYLDQNVNTYLAEVFADKSQVTFYELRKALVNRYEINTSIPLRERDFSVSFTTAKISASTYATKDSEEAPFYPYASTQASMASMAYEIELIPTNAYHFSWIHGNVDDFETSVYNYLATILDKSLNNGATDRNAIFNAMRSTYAAGNYRGCFTFFGVELTKEDDTVEIYSKQAYDNNKYGAKGAVSAILDTYLIGYKKMVFYIPLFFSLLPGGYTILTRDRSGAGKIYKEVYVEGNTTTLYYQLYRDTNEIVLDEYGNILWGAYIALPTRPAYWWNTLGIYNGFPWTESEGVMYSELLFNDGASTGRSVNNAGWTYGDQPGIWANKVTLPLALMDGFMRGDYAEVTNSSDFIMVDPKNLADITTREAVSAVYEQSACYGKLNRVTDLFAPVELNNSRLLPADNLYPDNSLYPSGESVRGNASMYQRLWTDSQGVQTFRYLIITYKTTEDGQEVEKTLQRTVNADGTTDYNMSDNWLFRNLVWTASQVGDLADEMADKMRNVSWFPFEMWCAGLPYLEPGDEIEITDKTGTHTSYVLQRQLNGIQNLQDTYIDGELDIF